MTLPTEVLKSQRALVACVAGSLPERHVMMTTVYVDFSIPRKPREVARDARDPFDHQAAVEALARTYSERGRTIRVYPVGLYVKPWRKAGPLDALYEAHDGRPTPEFR